MAEIGWIGLGIMGSRMATHLARAGHALTVWNRTPATADAWAAEHRARVAATPAECAAAADVLFTMVVDGAQVRSVLFGPEGAASGARPGALLVDCSTIAPAEAEALARDAREVGLEFVDAPVSGSSPRAADGTLTFMVGAEARALARVRPLLAEMGSLIVHAGPNGHGQRVKLLNNALAAANAAAVAQAIVVARAEGVDLDALVEVVGASSGGSAMMSLKAGPMREGDFTPLFKLAHMLKDVELALAAARDAGVEFPSAAAARDLLAEADDAGLGGEDFAALIRSVEACAGTRP
jgi:3-hydroxyisobutyrate dehydrogenase-like beta-hydroxyacid dehydrogenase